MHLSRDRRNLCERVRRHRRADRSARGANGIRRPDGHARIVRGARRARETAYAVDPEGPIMRTTRVSRPIPARTFSAFASLARIVTAACVAAAVPVACDRAPSGPEASSPPTAAPQVAAPQAAPAPKDDVRISKENWPNGSIKYSYEMRRNPDGKWARNGIGKAFYANGALEREGTYRDNKRVGVWKYYDDQGGLLRTEDRGDGGVE
jgi:hypothetical protein